MKSHRSLALVLVAGLVLAIAVAAAMSGRDGGIG
jgi:hypothetical protein